MKFGQRPPGEPRLDRLHEQRRLLMRDLCGRGKYRAIAVRFGPRGRRTIADGENVGIARGLQRLSDDELMRTIDFKPIEVREYRRRLDAGSPYDEIRVKHGAGRGVDTLRIDFGDAFAGEHRHGERAEKPGGGLRDLLR